MSSDEAERIVDAMDFDRDGAIDFKEFKSVVKA